MIVTSQCTITNIVKISENLRMFEFEIEKFIPWEPGMFLHLNLDSDKFAFDWSNSRAFSFASYGDKKAKILVRRVGQYTSRMFNELSIGSKFWIKYPFGNFFLNKDTTKVLIAAGTGIAPFLSYLEYVKKTSINSPTYIFHSVRTSQELIDKFVEIPSNVYYFKFVTRETCANTQNRHIEIADILKLNISKDIDVYICGSIEFVKKFEDGLKENGFKNIYSESWGWVIK
ncbi:MAG TPA: FAD-dependent oxidoreductase [Fervidobacterium nodosum]|nr:FAD-dependent oxidoreductase [Fervidobacterium nodosum]